MSCDVLVVGGGLFGQVAAAALRREGAEVCVIDDKRQGAGSAPAGCVIRPSWVGNMKRAELEDSLRLLDELYGLKDLELEARPTGLRVRCHRVEPNQILGGELWNWRALEIGQDATAYVMTRPDGGQATIAPRRGVVLACGQWANELAPWLPKVSGRWGWSHRGPPVKQPNIRLWAPYRQVVAFNMDDGRSWCGDGYALIESSFTASKRDASRERCADAVGATVAMIETQAGARPYAETGGAPCLMVKQGRVWAVTAGAKNGTIAAAWAARRLVREMLHG